MPKKLQNARQAIKNLQARRWTKLNSSIESCGNSSTASSVSAARGFFSDPEEFAMKEVLLFKSAPEVNICKLVKY